MTGRGVHQSLKEDPKQCAFSTMQGVVSPNALGMREAQIYWRESELKDFGSPMTLRLCLDQFLRSSCLSRINCCVCLDSCSDASHLPGHISGALTQIGALHGLLALS